jgi:hypothetical protein
LSADEAEQAASERDMGEFAECDDFDAAYALDPIYETPARAELRKPAHATILTRTPRHLFRPAARRARHPAASLLCDFLFSISAGRGH